MKALWHAMNGGFDISHQRSLTPLIHSKNLGSKWGLDHLWFKNETTGLSGSFKDRGALVAIRDAQRQGYQTIVTASSGNAGAAIAAHAAQAALHAVILVDPQVPSGKLRQIHAYGAEVRVIEGLFDQPSEQFIQMLKTLADSERAYLAFFWDPVNPVILQGFEVIAEEIVHQLGRVPDVVLFPTGGGDHLVAQGRAYLRLWHHGHIPHVPQLIAVQPEGSCPLVDAVAQELNFVPYRPNPRTAASGLRVAFSGDHALAMIQQSEGTEHHRHVAITVSEQAIAETQDVLARKEGLWIEASGVAALAAIPTLLHNGLLDPHACIVTPLTGAGWKDDRISYKS